MLLIQWSYLPLHLIVSSWDLALSPFFSVPWAGLWHRSAGMECRKRSVGYSYSTWSNWIAVSSHCSHCSCKMWSLCSSPGLLAGECSGELSLQPQSLCEQPAQLLASWRTEILYTATGHYCFFKVFFWLQLVFPDFWLWGSTSVWGKVLRRKPIMFAAVCLS